MGKMIKEIKYFEGYGLRIIPVCEGASPVGFQIVNTKGEAITEVKMLHEAENFIVSNKAHPKGFNVGSAAELRVH